MDYKRFDNDSETALNGGHIWHALVEAGRATLPGGLAGGYLAALLGEFDRALTPREVVQQFFKNPAFPLATSTDEIRRVMYELITSDWELVDADGNRLGVASPAQISINSISQTLRPRRQGPMPPVPISGGGQPPEGGEPPGGGAWLPGGGDGQLPLPGGVLSPGGSGGSKPAPTPPPHRDPGPTVYKRYRVQLANKSITSGDTRQQAWQLLQELRKIMDPSDPADHQLVSLDLTLVTAEGDQGAIEAKAEALGAQVTVEDDDF